MRVPTVLVLGALVGLAAGCGGGGGSSAPGGTSGAPGVPAGPPTTGPTVSPTAIPTSAPSPQPPVGPTAAPLNVALQLPAGFYGETVATGLNVPRQLVALPNGDLLVGTDARGANVVYIIPNADGAGGAGAPKPFVTVPNGSAQGIAMDAAFANLYVATNQSVWRVPYRAGDQSEPTPGLEVAKLRRGSVVPGSDGDVHHTSSVAVAGNALYVGVGSGCNACAEIDPTRATIQRVDLTTLAQTTAAVRFRNAIALTVNPATGTVWAGGAGQDGLMAMSGAVVSGVTDPRQAHPYEFFDALSAHAGVPDYGWPVCEENDRVYNATAYPGASCISSTDASKKVVAPAVEFVAYSTLVGAVFYPARQTGAYAFPAAYRGGAFVSMHGSWHEDANGLPLSQPDVAYVPMNGDAPVAAVNWNDPTRQWSSFLYGFQDTTNGNRIGRPAGLAVGPDGSLFVADDYAGAIYRIRPGSGPAAARLRAPRAQR